jgi:DNA-binding transcriptional LysR family regulator
LEARDLKYFAVAAEHGNLRRAAEALDMSQPALSKSLRRLEKWAHAKLVKRTPKGVELTAVGAALLKHARRLKLYLDDVGHEVTDLSQGRAGHLRIGVTPVNVEYPVAQACVRLLGDSPKVTLKILIGGNEVLFPALRKGELELTISGIPASPYEGLVHEPVFDDTFVVYASVNHPLAGRKHLTISDIARERWALAESDTLPNRRLQRMFEEEGFPSPIIAMETAAMAPKISLVAASDVLGFTARRFLREAAARLRLTELRVKGLPWIRAVGVSYRKDAYLSPAARRFIELLKMTAKEIAAEEP